MPWVFNDEFKTRSGLGISDGRGCSIKLNNGGSDFGGSAAFDMFPDTAVVGDALWISLSRKFWGVQFAIGTAFAATAVEFIWEYSTSSSASPTWSTLRVENIDAFTKTGTQIVRFTPPDNWMYSNDRGYLIRCRISSLTGITEGGRTNALTQWNIKPLVGTGTSGMTLSTAEANDLAGNYIILSEQTPAASLTPIEMPVNALKESSKLDVVLAGCTLGTSDTVVITGIDQQGGSLVETIDVSEGNATYTTNSVFRNVTNVACNGFSDGTIKVIQKRWGAITQRYSYDFALRACLSIGDGSTPTTMSVTDTNLTFALGFFHYANQATLTFGSTTTVVGETYGVNGCTIYEGVNFCYNPGMFWRRALGTSTLTYNGCRLNFTSMGGQNGGFMIANANSTVTIRDCSIRGSGQFYFTSPVLMVRNKFLGCSWWQCGTGLEAGSKGMEATAQTSVEYNNVGGTITYLETFMPSVRLWIYKGQLKLINCSLSVSQIFLGYGSTNKDAIKLIFTLAMTVQDESGNIIEGANVLIKDVNGTAFLNTQTDANGQIPQTELWNATATSYSSGGPYVWKYYNPYTVTISKPGYQTKTLKLTMDRKREEVEVLEKEVPIYIGKGKVLVNIDPKNSQNNILA